MFIDNLKLRTNSDNIWTDFKNKKVSTDIALIFSNGTGGNFIASEFAETSLVTSTHEYFANCSWFSPEDKLTDLTTRTDSELIEFLRDISVRNTKSESHDILIGHIHPVYSDKLYNLDINEYCWIYTHKETAWFTRMLAFIKFFCSNEYETKFSNILSVVNESNGIELPVGELLRIRDLLRSVLTELQIDPNSVIVFNYAYWSLITKSTPSVSGFRSYINDKIQNFFTSVDKFPGFSSLSESNLQEFEYFKNKVNTHNKIEYIDLFKDGIIPANSKINEINLINIQEYYDTNFRLIDRYRDFLSSDQIDQLESRFKPVSHALNSLRRTEVISKIADANFDILHDKRVLELGSFEGWFTEEILKYTDDVTCVELNTHSCDILDKKFGNAVKIINDDFHSCLRDAGTFDAVILYGVLYHSCAPLKILEDVVNYCDPNLVLIEVFQDPKNKEAVPVYLDEVDNIPGNRYSNFKTCGISVGVGLNICVKAMTNLGYKLIKTNRYINYFLPDYPFKRHGTYLTFSKIQ